MPTLSVTAIGIAVALVAMIRGKPPTRMLLRGLLGAWLGFFAGAVSGVLFDVVLTDGHFVAVLGHLGAAVGAVVAVTGVSLPRRSTDASRPTAARSATGW